MFPEAATDDVGVPTAGGVEVVGLVLLVATAARRAVISCSSQTSWAGVEADGMGSGEVAGSTGFVIVPLQL